MRSDAIGQRDVGSGGEIDWASQAALLGEKMEDGVVIRQMGGVERRAGGNFGLDLGFAAGDQPSRNAGQAGRMGADENAHGVMEGVGFNQRAVEVDAKWNGL